MLPEINIEMPSGDTEIQPSDNYAMKIRKDVIIGHVDGIDAMKQVIYKILGTERYENVIYSWDYGLETRDLIGQPYDYVCAALTDRIKEALMQDDRIQEVSGFKYEQSGKHGILVSFNVATIFGDVEGEKTVNI